MVAAQASVASARRRRKWRKPSCKSAEAQVTQNAAALQAAQLDLDHTQIVAPVDGTVVSRNMDVGQTVAASFQAPTIFLIAQDLTKMQVDTNVDESDVGPIRVGQQANFTVDAYPGVIFPGVVSQIRQAPINVQNVITYDVVVEVSNADLKLFPGMTANVKIVTGRVERALRLPAAAMRFHPAAVRGFRGSREKPVQGRATTGGCAGTESADDLCPGPRPTQARAGATGHQRRQLYRDSGRLERRPTGGDGHGIENQFRRVVASEFRNAPLRILKKMRPWLN